MPNRLFSKIVQKLINFFRNLLIFPFFLSNSIDKENKIPYFLNGIHKAFKSSSFLIYIFVLIIFLNNVNTVKSQYRPKWPSPIVQREIFFLNLEDGYFGCQINESIDILQLFDLTKLCDNKPNCFKGSDELSAELKCTDRAQCHPNQPTCLNGVCLDNLCYCNDGYGGKGCDLPDENECKYRPCDVFAHCTNTLGSFYCTCLPGYDGDGYTCHDVNECEDPTLSKFCVENAECCNLPGHFICKCQNGFEGNGTQECVDVDECLKPDSCGRGAICTNKKGSFECHCPPGFTGDPTQECWDIDECKTNPCNNGTCHNKPGEYSCTCLPGYAPNPTAEQGCVDIDECLKPDSCGKGAVCMNTEASYFCQCPPGFTGDPRIGCVDVDECSASSCGANTICTNNIGSFSCQCKEGFSGDPYLSAGCLDINECNLANVCAPENSDCINLQGGFECKCKTGTTGNPMQKCWDINECDSNPCGSGATCINLERGEGYKCVCPEKFVARGGNPEFGCDKAECETDENCIGNSRCLNSFCYCPPPYLADNDCTCPTGYISDVYAGCLSREENKISYAECTEKVACPPNTVCYRGLCSRKDSCSTNKDCFKDSTCKLVNENVGKQCVDPCDVLQCGPNAYCSTVNHQPACHCNTSYTGNPNDLIFGCSPKGPPPFMIYCESDSDCDQKSICKSNFAGAKICTDVCDSTQCGPAAFCRGVNRKAECYCAKHFTGNPYDLNNGCSLPASAHLCSTDDDCSAEKSCILTLEGVRNCIDVCKYHQCTEGSRCIIRDHRPLCECLPGFARVSTPGPNGTILGTCEQHLCESDNHCSVDEHCIVNNRGLLDCIPACAEMQCGENAECISVAHVASCVCKANYEGNAMDLIKGCQPVASTVPCEGCKTTREPRVCVSSPDCGDAQECFEGLCRFLCMRDNECIVGEKCIDGFCVPLDKPGTSITIHMPTRDQDEDDENDSRSKVTPSMPLIPDQKIVQPNLQPSTFPNLKTDPAGSAFRQPIKPSRPTVIEDDNEFNNQLPPKVDIQKQPQHPSFDQVIDRNKQQNVPEVPTRPKDVSQPPRLDENKDNNQVPQQPNIKHDPNLVGEPILPVFEEPKRRPSVTERPTSNVDDAFDKYVNKVKHPPSTQPEYKHPLDNKIPSIEHDTDSIYNPPEYKPTRPDVSSRPDTKPDISRPTDSRQPQFPPNIMPEYKHPLQPNDNLQPNLDDHSTVHPQRKPTINDRKPFDTEKDEQEFPMIVDKRPIRPNMTISDLSDQFPDINRPPRPDLLHPHHNKPPKVSPDSPSTVDHSNIPPFKDQRQPTKPVTSRPDVGTRLDVNRPDISRPDTSRPDISRPDISRPDISRPDISRPDTGRPDISRPNVINKPDRKQQIPSRSTTESPFLIKDDIRPSERPDEHLTPEVREPMAPHGIDDSNEYNPPSSKPFDFDKDQNNKFKSKEDEKVPSTTFKDINKNKQSTSSPHLTDDRPFGSRPQIKTDVSNNQRPPSNVPDFDWPTRVDPKASSKKPPTQPTPTTNVVTDFRQQPTSPSIKQPLEPVYTDSESRQPSTTPESIRDLNKPSKTDIRTQTKIENNNQQVQKPKYPVSIKPDLSRPNTYLPPTRTSSSDFTSSPKYQYQPTSKPPEWNKIQDLRDKQNIKDNQIVTQRPSTSTTSTSTGKVFTNRPTQFSDTITSRPPAFKPPTIDKQQASKPIQDNKQTSKPTSTPNTFTEVRQPPFVDTRHPSKQQDKNKLQEQPQFVDKDRSEPKESSKDDNFNFNDNKFTSSRPFNVPKPATIRPPSLDSKRPSTGIKYNNIKTDNKQQQDKTVRPDDRVPFDDFTISPEVRITTQPNQTRVTEVKHSSMQDFTHKPNVKTQHTSTSYQQPTIPPQFKHPDITRPDINRPDVTRPDRTRPDITRPDITRPDITRPDITRPDINRPDVTRPDKTRPDITRPEITRPDKTRPDITRPDLARPDKPDINTPSSKEPTSIGGEKCVNNYCVPFFDEGMLQVPINKSGSTAGTSTSTGNQPYRPPIATVTPATTEESMDKHGSHEDVDHIKPSIGGSKPTDHHSIVDPNAPDLQTPDRTINIQICVDGVCHDKIRGCLEDNDCPSDKTCDLQNRQCISPCYVCGPNSECSAVDHSAVCVCPKGTTGEPLDKEVGCFVPPETTDPSTERTIPPVSQINVMCQSDGIQVGVKLGGYDGIVYVKGYSQEYECRRSVRSDERDVIDFKVGFGQCGLFHANGEASFILVVQKHPKLVTYRARAYHIKCMYNTGERVISLGFNVSMITTSGTIANTGPPPTCSLSICTLDGNEVSSAEIGDDLLLKVNVQPGIYGGFARSCIAKTMEEEGEFQYEVTDANGCATDPSIFANWEYDESKKALVARFNAFKFPSSNNLRFQCNIRICFGSCSPANCEETEAYGRRRRRREIDDTENDQSLTLTNSLGIETYKEGQLREEIQVQSNAILTFEKREQPSEPFGQQRSEDELDHVCLPKLSLVLSMIITTLLSIVCIAVAISCWLMAYRRKANHLSPMQHPEEIPNPIQFSTPEPNLPIEPIPDYYNSM